MGKLLTPDVVGTGRDTLVAMSRRRDGPVVHFIHIGKTAGSTLVELLRRHGLDRRVAIHGHEFTLRDVPVGEQCFFFIRDPVSRFVSAFNSRRREGRPTYVYPHSPGEAEAFARFGTPNDLAEALAAPDSAVRAEADRAFAAIHHLRRGYEHYLVSPAYLAERARDILFIGRQETFGASWDAVRELLGVAEAGPDSLPRIHAAPPGQSTALSPRAVADLRKRLAGDLAIHEHLIRDP